VTAFATIPQLASDLFDNSILRFDEAARIK
jgi:hypothetical protein